MSGALDSKARALTEKLLKKFGKIAQYSEENEPLYNEETGETTEVASTIHNVTVYIDTQKTGEFISNGLISNTDTVILISASDLGFDPKAGDDIIFPSSATYSVKSFNAIWSGEEIALYEVICIL